MLARFHKGLDHFVRVLLFLQYLGGLQKLVLYLKREVSLELRRELLRVFYELNPNHQIFGLSIVQSMIIIKSLISDLRIISSFRKLQDSYSNKSLRI